MIRYFCDRCGEEIKDKALRYILKVDLYASPGPLIFRKEELETNLSEEIEKLLKEMENKNVDELTDEVFVNYEFDLCKKCRDSLYAQFSRKTISKEIFNNFYLKK